MLLAERLTFHYHPASPLVRNLSFQLNPGEITGLPGRSGIGKSTLAFLLAGLIQPLSGVISCNGSPLPDRGYCPVQLICQHPELAVNPRWKIRKVLKEGNDEPMPLVNRFGIEAEWLDRHPHELSGGELQRISLIRVMNSGTRYLIADEITSSLDANTQALIWSNLLPWARENNVGILVISHDARLLSRVCDRIDTSFTS